MEEKIKFGPSGNEDLFYQQGNKTSLEAPAWLKNLGLSAYEYSFGKGYMMGSETAHKLGIEAEKNGITISVHAPYYINFANESEEMVEKSYNYVLTGLKFLKCMRGEHLVFHPASQGKLEREKAVALARERLIILAKKVKEAGYGNFKLCPETMGKPLQIGTYKEIIDLCTIDDIYVPTFDFGHIYTLNLGNFGSYEDYKKVFEYSIEKLGFERTKNCHIHFSKIEYGNKGEVRHLNFNSEDYGPDYVPLLKVIKELGLTPTIICESKNNMATDALTLKETYEKID